LGKGPLWDRQGDLRGNLKGKGRVFKLLGFPLNLGTGIKLFPKFNLGALFLTPKIFSKKTFWGFGEPF